MLHTFLFNVAQPAFNNTRFVCVIIHANVGSDRRQSIVGVHGVRKVGNPQLVALWCSTIRSRRWTIIKRPVIWWSRPLDAIGTWAQWYRQNCWPPDR